MYIQILTFHLGDDHGTDAIGYARAAVLGLAEFDGFVSVTPVATVHPGSVSVMAVWRDWRAVEAFRHSELYARLQMSPSYDSIDDRAFGVDTEVGPATRLRELLAVA
jgi:hypothetical protein